jgi:hypothetical protein
LIFTILTIDFSVAKGKPLTAPSVANEVALRKSLRVKFRLIILHSPCLMKPLYNQNIEKIFS